MLCPRASASRPFRTVETPCTMARSMDGVEEADECVACDFGAPGLNCARNLRPAVMGGGAAVPGSPLPARRSSYYVPELSRRGRREVGAAGGFGDRHWRPSSSLIALWPLRCRDVCRRFRDCAPFGEPGSQARSCHPIFLLALQPHPAGLQGRRRRLPQDPAALHGREGARRQQTLIVWGLVQGT